MQMYTFKNRSLGNGTTITILRYLSIKILPRLMQPHKLVTRQYSKWLHSCVKLKENKTHGNKIIQ